MALGVARPAPADTRDTRLAVVVVFAPGLRAGRRHWPAGCPRWASPTPGAFPLNFRSASRRLAHACRAGPRTSCAALPSASFVWFGSCVHAHFHRVLRRFKRNLDVVSLAKLQQWVDKGRLDASKPITLRDLWLSGIVGRHLKEGVKLLGTGAQGFTAKLDLTVSDASASAIARVEEVGGKVTTQYYGRVALRGHLKPQKFAVLPKNPTPPSKLMKHYNSDAKRGYLSRHVQMREWAASQEARA